jgi:hypothetical protein
MPATLHFIVDPVKLPCAGHVSALFASPATRLPVAVACQPECRTASGALRRFLSMREPECDDKEIKMKGGNGRIPLSLFKGEH